MYLQTIFSGQENKRNGSSAATASPVVQREPAPREAAVSMLLRNTPAERRTQPAGAPRIKTYIAESVPHAMTLARSEMGEDAILIQTRRREAGNGSTQFEVTFGIVPNAVPPSRKPSEIAEKQSSREVAAEATAADSEVARQLGSLRCELAALQTMLRQSAFGRPSAPQDPIASRAYEMLLRNHLDAEFASKLVDAIQPGAKSPAEAVREQLAAQIRTDSTIGQGGKAVVLIGPPACGKTTALIKLAVEYGLKLGNGIEFFSLTRTSPDRTLESMAAILGAPCEALLDAAALESALARPRVQGTLVLVDSNGFGSGASEDEMEVAAILASGANADVHLVLPVTWHGGAIRQTVDRFEIFQPTRLLLTMADQAAAVYGPLIHEGWRTGKLLSFVSGGTATKTVLRPADLGWIVARMFEGETGGERH